MTIITTAPTAPTAPTAAVTEPADRANTATTAPPLRISAFRHTGGLPTPAFERAFIAQLSHHRRADRPVGEVRRSAVTVLASALRAGNPLSQVLTIARGLTAGELADAYDTIDQARCDSLAAWDELCGDPTPATFHRLSCRIERLFPTLVSSLRSVVHDPQVFADRVVECSRRSSSVAVEAAAVEAQIGSEAGRDRALVAMLDDGRNGGVYHEAVYCPQRVGDIVPSRLASLLDAPEAEAA